jgi:hypothetical protein
VWTAAAKEGKTMLATPTRHVESKRKRESKGREREREREREMWLFGALFASVVAI